MFWGLNLKPNRKYSQKIEKSFHISQAALDANSTQEGRTQIFISTENQRFLLCTLRKDVCEQVMLDLNFREGSETCFQSVGSGDVTLSGYLIEEDIGDDLLDVDEEEVEDVESSSETDDVDLRDKLIRKANKKKTEKGKAASKAVEEDDEDEEDDGDFIENDDDDDEDEEEEDAEGEEDENDSEDEDDDDEEDDSQDEEVQQPKAKQARLEKPEKQQNGVANQKDQKSDKKSKKELKKEKQQQQKQQGKQQQPKQQGKQQKAGGERVLSGGVKIVDLRVGNGPEVKPGKRAQLYYEGRLLSNNKVFDSLKSGAGFKFNLGRGEVIKGWDVGVIGMKVGGKRRLICPPHMAYGSRGSPPTIPPNSTLVFDVELKAIN